ncbi:MAG: type IV pilus secretin PilQ [Desulfosarcina sp.]|nr:type IV pilus secretin PilQ [Desulfobacterales bacterium]
MNYKKDKLLYTGVVCALLIIMILGAVGCASRNITVSQPEQAMDSAAEAKLITNITSKSEDDGSVVISVNSNRPLTYSSVKQPLPLSVILYFPETTLNDSITDEISKNSIIGSVKASELQGAGHTSKIIISLLKDVSYEVTSEDTELIIAFTMPAEEASTGVPLKPVTKAKADENKIASISEDDIAGTSVISTTRKPINKDIVSLLEKGNPPVNSEKVIAGTINSDIALVNRIDFSSEDAGKSTIIVGTTKPIKYKIEKAGNNRVNLCLEKTKIPSYHNRPLITTRFASAVDRITPVQTPALKNTSLLSIELRESIPYFVEQTDNLLFIHFEASSIPPRPLEEANLPPWKKVLAQAVASSEADRPLNGNIEKGEKGRNGSNMHDLAENKPKAEGNERTEFDYYQTRSRVSNYTGEKIALDFYKTDIQNVFRILKEISKKNFAIDKDVSGTVSLTLDNPVPWDEVLDLVLDMNSLGMVYKGNIIRIATLATLKNEDMQSRNLLRAKQEAELQEDLVTEFFPINYADAETVKKLLDDEKTDNYNDNDKDGSRLSVAVDKRNNMLLVTAPPILIKRIRKIIQKVDNITPQVIIEARIVEVTDDFSRSIGVQWSSSGEINLPRAGDALDFNLAFNHAVASSSTIGATFQRILGNNVLVDAQLTAEQAKSNAKIISSPKVITLDNEKAAIKQGTQHPYLERDDSGGSSVKFKDVDLLLEVTPHITFDMRILLELKITKNDVTGYYGPELVPIISTKEVESLLILEDGGTVVLGGVRQDTVNSGESATPWLSKIPVLGWLFKSQTKSTNRSELLIFITPTIVQL